MAFEQILPEYEFYEVLNAFPVLKVFLGKLKIPLDSLKEGVSVFDFLSSLNFSDDEREILLNKMNQEVISFLKNGEVGKYEQSEGSGDKGLGIEMIA